MFLRLHIVNIYKDYYCSSHEAGLLISHDYY